MLNTSFPLPPCRMLLITTFPLKKGEKKKQRENIHSAGRNITMAKFLPVLAITFTFLAIFHCHADKINDTRKARINDCQLQYSLSL